MPTYEYQCRECGRQFELRQGFDADTTTACPDCGQVAERQISLVPIIFKGSGWYVNDHGKRKSTLGDSSPAESDDGPSPAGGDGGHSHSHGGHSHTHSHGGHSHSHGDAAPAPASAESSTAGS